MFSQRVQMYNFFKDILLLWGFLLLCFFNPHILLVSLLPVKCSVPWLLSPNVYLCYECYEWMNQDYYLFESLRLHRLSRHFPQQEEEGISSDGTLERSTKNLNKVPYISIVNNTTKSTAMMYLHICNKKGGFC